MLYNNSKLLHVKKKNIQFIRIKGIIKKFQNDFGYIELKSKKKYFIPYQQVIKVLHEDIVIAQIHIKKDHTIIELEKLIDSNFNFFIGKIKKINNNLFVLPKYPFSVELFSLIFSNQDYYNIKENHWIIVKLVQHKLQGYDNFQSELVKYIIKNDDFLIPWKTILSRYNICYHSPTMNFKKIFFDNKIFRKELTNLEFITIDNSDTKDIDDAIFLKKELDNHISMIVAIADPTAYISVNSKFDLIASKRLFTNYLPGLNIPMLPVELCEDLCSLKVNFRRPVLACKIFIDQHGKISKKIDFFLAWIKSQAKLNYEDVSNWIEKKGSWIPKSQKIINQINLLHELYKLRIIWRQKHSVIFKEKLEYKFHFTTNQSVIHISTEYRRIAHKMIEEAMIIANLSAAKFLSKKIGFGIYNTHSGFKKKNIKKILNILQENNIYISSHKVTSISGFCKIYRILNILPNFFIEHKIRKYQSFGKISLTPKPHFALGFTEYATWTSPMRKYSDMINHRLLKNIILGEFSEHLNYEIISKITYQKRVYHIVKREIENFLYIKFLKNIKNKNKYFIAEIFEIFCFGIKAKLIENGAHVFIPSSFIHHVQTELFLNQEKGIVYIKGKEKYKIFDHIIISLIDTKLLKQNILAKLI